LRDDRGDRAGRRAGGNRTPAFDGHGLYFQTSSTGGFNPSAYWWSTTRVPVTTTLNQPLSTALTAGLWTNCNGQTDPIGFAAAVANVTSWGVSFGGGCHYASGVGTPTGSAIFTLQPGTRARTVARRARSTPTFVKPRVR
jgi:hypothetical protein